MNVKIRITKFKPATALRDPCAPKPEPVRLDVDALKRQSLEQRTIQLDALRSARRCVS